MKIKILMFILINFIFVAAAQAKIQYKGSTLSDIQTKTIKGFLYEVSNSALNKEISNVWKPLFAKTLVWLEDIQNSELVYNLESCKNEEAKIVIDTIEVITRVLRGDFGIDPAYAIAHWTNIGQRVVANYSQQNTLNSNTNKKETRIAWKLELKPMQNKPQTKDLLYRAW